MSRWGRTEPSRAQQRPTVLQRKSVVKRGTAARSNCEPLADLLSRLFTAIIIQHFMRVALLGACQSTLARHPQDNAKLCVQRLEYKVYKIIFPTNIHGQEPLLVYAFIFCYEQTC